MNVRVRNIRFAVSIDGIRISNLISAANGIYKFDRVFVFSRRKHSTNFRMINKQLEIDSRKSVRIQPSVLLIIKERKFHWSALCSNAV